jgi:hypothetical protein
MFFLLRTRPQPRLQQPREQRPRQRRLRWTPMIGQGEAETPIRSKVRIRESALLDFV